MFTRREVWAETYRNINKSCGVAHSIFLEMEISVAQITSTVLGVLWGKVFLSQMRLLATASEGQRDTPW